MFNFFSKGCPKCGGKLGTKINFDGDTINRFYECKRCGHCIPRSGSLEEGELLFLIHCDLRKLHALLSERLPKPTANGGKEEA